MALSPLLRRVAFADVPGWSGDVDRLKAFEAFRRSAIRSLEKPYRSGALGISAEALSPAFEAARKADFNTDAQADAFFQDQFVPFHIRQHAQGSDHPQGPGFVTAYYEPIAKASAVRTERFRYPLLRRPPDLIDIDDDNRPASLDPSLRFGRMTPTGITEYFDRAQIERGALDHQSLALAWLEDPVDLFFIHVQGAARLELADGRSMAVTYAAKSGHPFTGPGRVLIEIGELPADKVTMQSIRDWFQRNPTRIDEIQHRNRSYIFFRPADIAVPALGPIAAAKVQLTPGRSMAVDRLLHTFGTPIHVHSPSLQAFDDKPYSRLLIAQDTGSAIVGPARGDLFAGTGPEAGEVAGVVKHAADFFALVPAGLAGQFR